MAVTMSLHPEDRALLSSLLGPEPMPVGWFVDKTGWTRQKVQRGLGELSREGFASCRYKKVEVPHGGRTVRVTRGFYSLPATKRSEIPTRKFAFRP